MVLYQPNYSDEEMLIGSPGVNHKLSTT